MDVGEWLRGLGLERYASAFRDAEIAPANLADLTDADLRELGLPLGPRKTVLRAIGALGAPSATTAAEVETTPVAAPPAERRQLTVMFIDLVGSTALSARLDPEEMGELLKGFQNTVAGEISRLHGHVAKFMGDGVLAYFGFPAAHEDDAERAARAGLATTAAIARVRTPSGEPVAVRIGIATGLVVVGDLIGEGAAREETVVGETPNVAARLQALAAPGQVVVADSTRRLLGDLFDLEDLGRQALKGIAEPVPAFAVLGERAIESRFEARRAGALGAIVGRDHELSLLLERWRKAGSGEGQVVLLTGEAGIGKSRITRGLIDAVATEPHTRISYQCSPYHGDSALWPVIQQLTRAAGLGGDDPLERQLDKMERLIARSGADVRAAAPFMATLLGLDGEVRYGALDLRPEQIRTRTLSTLADQLTGLAGIQPVLFVVEDAHWIDPTTLELLDLCLDRIGAARVMLLVTARPVFRHGFGGHPIGTSLALNRLGRDDTAAIVARLTGGKRLPEELLAEIAAKTDGVPLFIEELTKTALESGMLRETADAFVLDGPLSALAIPTSLHDSLMARLDRMQPVKEVAQTAACIGREFSYRLLAEISPQPGPEVETALERLAAAELIFRRGTPPEASYLFKHALVRDAAYESLLRSKRQAVHRRILAALETTDALPQLLGHHAREAGLIEQAIGHFEAAGHQALARPAYVEAIANLRQAVELAAGLGDAPSWRERVLELQSVIGQASIGGYGHGAIETGEAYRRAMNVLGEIIESPLRLPVYYGNWAHHYVRAEHGEALRLADEMIASAEGQGDELATLVANRVRGTSLAMLGRTGEALPHLERAWQLYDPARHRERAASVGQEPGVCALIYKGICLAQRGAVDQASRIAEEAIDLARQSGHHLTIAYALGHATVLWLMLRHTARATPLIDENIAYSEANGIRIWRVFSVAWQVLLRDLEGRHPAALAAAEQARVQLRASGTALFLPFMLGGEAASLLALGRHADCEVRLDDARRQIEASGERWIEPDIHRILGNLRLARGDAAAAQLCYRRAIEIARGQEGRLLELRATTALCRLLASQGERHQAQDLLTPLNGWFTEGFDARDLVEAQALLDELQ